MEHKAVFNSAADLRARGFQLRTAPVTLLTLDPSGDGTDFDGMIALSREEHQKGEPHDPDFAVEFVFRVLLAHRLPKEWEFPDKLAAMLAMDRTLRGWTRQKRQHTHIICVETNGVGYGYASSLATKTNTKIVPYVTVGQVSSSRVPPPDAKVSMPRLKALDNVRILMETGYLKIVRDAPGAAMLQTELGAFVWRKIGRPEAMQGQTDDLVMALTGAAWIGSKVLPPVLKQVKVGGRQSGRTTLGTRMRIQ